jgi:RimJ/RimL family protein N-acetyltransferase
MNAPQLDPADWHPEAIAGRLVVLRRHRPEHLPSVARWYRDPEIARLTRFHVAPVSDDEIRAFFANRLLSPAAFAYAIHVASTDRLVGTTTFSALDPDNRSVMFHISIGERDAWGRGYGTEATQLMIGHAFERLGLHRVALSVFAFNERAMRAYLRAGFTIEGRAREAVWRDGAFWDEVHMGILAREWRARRSGGAPHAVPGSGSG